MDTSDLIDYARMTAMLDDCEYSTLSHTIFLETPRMFKVRLPAGWIRKMVIKKNKDMVRAQSTATATTLPSTTVSSADSKKGEYESDPLTFEGYVERMMKPSCGQEAEAYRSVPFINPYGAAYAPIPSTPQEEQQPTARLKERQTQTARLFPRIIPSSDVTLTTATATIIPDLACGRIVPTYETATVPPTTTSTTTTSTSTSSALFESAQSKEVLQFTIKIAETVIHRGSCKIGKNVIPFTKALFVPQGAVFTVEFAVPRQVCNNEFIVKYDIAHIPPHDGKSKMKIPWGAKDGRYNYLITSAEGSFLKYPL